MKQIYKSILILVGSAFLLSSCDLDKSPYGNASFWNSKEEIKMGLNAAYEPLYQEEGYGRGHWWADISDDINVNRNKPVEIGLGMFGDAANTNTSGGHLDNWELMYKVIRRSNDVLRYTTPEIEMSDEERAIIIGEANFLRAYSYFYLAKRYGGLPFYDYRDPDNINKARETKDQTYANIESYLKETITQFEKYNLWKRVDGDLGNKMGSWGRPNLGAAYGLLAKLYAHWGKYAEAKEAALKVINSDQYSLNTTGNNGYANLFSVAGEKSDEVLFNLTNKAVRHQGTITSIICLSGEMSDGAGWYYFAPTQSLFNAYDAGDLRREVTMKKEGDLVNYKPFIKKLQEEEDKLAEKEKRAAKKITAPQAIRKDDIKDMSTGYMGSKYLAAYDVLDGWNWEAGQDVPLLRYSDILLIHAEAEIFLAGGGVNNRTQGVPAAAASFNKVHVRAFGNDGTKAIDAPNFNDLVKERRCELAYEDERHYDLVRWGLAKEVYANTTTAEDPRGPRHFDPVKHAHFPLPQVEIDNSHGVLKNNPLAGYSSFQ